MWSVFYMGVEFATGTLPWKSMHEKERIGELKQRYMNDTLVENLPDVFGFWLNISYRLFIISFLI